MSDSLEHTTHTPEDEAQGSAAESSDKATLVLVIAWSREEPHRVGEALIPARGARPSILGRGSRATEAEEHRLLPVKQRPGVNLPSGLLTARRISRRQLRFSWVTRHRLMVEKVGRCALLVDGEETQQSAISAGMSVELEDELLLYAVSRPAVFPVLRDWPGVGEHVFGGADEYGLVGESATLWALREKLAFVGKRWGHTLVHGPSGSGKELVAQALHALSKWAERPLVSRNAATIPESLLDAELFGHAANYPNAGMPEREGLIGAADGSSLFLDEMGELSEAMQAHLLRVLDGGEYQRLGESKVRKADLRVIGATNRDLNDLKSDLRARFRHTLLVPPIQTRREDIPLLIDHLVRLHTARDPELSARFMQDTGEGSQHPRVDVDVVRALLCHPLHLQIRELDGLLWRCMAESRGESIELPRGLLPAAVRSDEMGVPGVNPNSLDPETIRACMEKHQGVQEKVWRALGLQSRYVLRRLLKKHGLDPR